MSRRTVAWYVWGDTFTNTVIRHRADDLRLEFVEGGIRANFGCIAPVWECPYQLIAELKDGMTKMSPRLEWRVFEKLDDGSIVERPDLGSAGERRRRKAALIKGGMRRTSR